MSDILKPDTETVLALPDMQQENPETPITESQVPSSADYVSPAILELSRNNVKIERHKTARRYAPIPLIGAAVLLWVNTCGSAGGGISSPIQEKATIDYGAAISDIQVNPEVTDAEVTTNGSADFTIKPIVAGIDFSPFNTDEGVNFQAEIYYTLMPGALTLESVKEINGKEQVEIIVNTNDEKLKLVGYKDKPTGDDGFAWNLFWTAGLPDNLHERQALAQQIAQIGDEEKCGIPADSLKVQAVGVSNFVTSEINNQIQLDKNNPAMVQAYQEFLGQQFLVDFTANGKPISASRNEAVTLPTFMKSGNIAGLLNWTVNGTTCSLSKKSQQELQKYTSSDIAAVLNK